MQKRSKFFLPAGLISLSILPFLVFAHYYQVVSTSQHLLEVAYLKKDDKFLALPKIAEDKLLRIKLTGNTDDGIKLKFFEVAARELRESGDTTFGIEVTLDRQIKYSQIIKLYNICLIEKLDRYIHLEDKFLVFGQSTDTLANDSHSYTPHCMVCVPLPEAQSAISSFLNDRPITAMLSAILFFGLICFFIYQVGWNSNR